MVELIRGLLNNLGYIIIIAFLFTKFPNAKNIFTKIKYSKKDLVLLTIFFGGLAILGTYSGISYKDSIANIRNIGIIVSGLIVAPEVGIASGIIAGIHRLFFETGKLTALPCSISTITGGFLSAYLYKYVNEKNKYIYGFFSGFLIENLSMILILILSPDKKIAEEIVTNIYFPMIFANALGVPIVILLIENIMIEKEILAGKQAKLSLEVADKTLPFFTSNELNTVCKIIMESLNAKVVVLSDEKNIIGSYSYDSEYKITHNEIKSDSTKKALKTGKYIITKKEGSLCVPGRVSSSIVVPLYRGSTISGTLKVYFDKQNKLNENTKYLILGLSKIISTQIELTQIENFKKMADKANLKMLQAQINPHFLFNALNTISSLTRTNPEKARETIVNLSNILRFNLENFDNFVTLEKELHQLKSYVNIEKVRFGDKINIEYLIDNNLLNVKIPSLIIQPIVENSIKHGILKQKNGGKITLEIKEYNQNIIISVTDNGVGIDNNIALNLYSDINKGIGLKNINDRLNILYKEKLNIERLNNGTKIYFYIKRSIE